MRIATAALLLAACAPSKPTPQSAPALPCDLVLVTIDTLRADHVHAYGHVRETTPHLDALAAEGVVFENAFAPMATTLPSHLSMLTGLHPHQHGVKSNLGAIGSPYVPGPDQESLAMFLSRAGYETAAFVSSAPLSTATGIQAGFDLYDEPQGPERNGAETMARVLAWLDQRPDPERPYFLWVHLWDVHDPNTPPPGYAERFAHDGHALQRVQHFELDPDALTKAFGAGKRARHFYPDQYDAVKRKGKRAKAGPVTEATLVDLQNRYDGDVFYADERLGELLDVLDARRERTAMAVTSDHGQGLGWRNWLEHGITSLECVRVPLVLRFPHAMGIPPQRITHNVSHVDLMPTLLARLQPPGWQGFAAQSTGADALAPRSEPIPVLSVRVARDRKVWNPGLEASVTYGRWRLISREGTELELYDRQSDPLELTNLAEEPAHAALIAELQARLDELLAERPASPTSTAELDAETAARQRGALNSLGYTGDDDE